MAHSNDDPAAVSRRQVLLGAAATSIGVATAGAFGQVPPEAQSTAAATAPATTRRPDDGDAVPITLDVNGQSYPLTLEPRTTLLDCLREDLGLTGSKKGCDHGQCGACTVLIDGRRSLSCLSLAIMSQGKPITTIEGLAKGEELHPVQQAFIDHDGFQCGYCTPGQICSAVGLLKEGHAKTDDEIREQMAGNLCRCGAYPGIVAAVRQAMQTA